MKQLIFVLIKNVINLTMENFQINLLTDIGNSKTLCSEMGLTVTNSEENIWIRLINQLKNQNIINGL